jgi:hypothetical protein
MHLFNLRKDQAQETILEMISKSRSRGRPRNSQLEIIPNHDFEENTQLDSVENNQIVTHDNLDQTRMIIDLQKQIINLRKAQRGFTLLGSINASLGISSSKNFLKK